MADAVELLGGGGADPLGRRRSINELRMRRFEFDEPAEQPVVLGIPDRWIIEDVVPVVVLVEGPAQRVDFARGNCC